MWRSLKDLQIQVENPVTGSSGEAIDCATVTNLFELHFPVANELFIDLPDDESEYIYEIPYKFISGESSPNIQKLEIAGSFTAES